MWDNNVQVSKAQWCPDEDTDAETGEDEDDGSQLRDEHDASDASPPTTPTPLMKSVSSNQTDQKKSHSTHLISSLPYKTQSKVSSSAEAFKYRTPRVARLAKRKAVFAAIKRGSWSD